MRRWVCVVALLAGFTAPVDFRSARSRIAAPIERQIELSPAGPGLRLTAAWWRRP